MINYKKFNGPITKQIDNTNSFGRSPGTFSIMGWAQSLGYGTLSKRLAIGYYKSCYPVSSGVNKISNALKNITPIVCDKDGNIVDNNISDLFVQPNVFSDWADFIEKANLYDKTTGETFVMLEGITKTNSIRILESQYMTIQCSSNRISSITYNNQGEHYTFSADEEGRLYTPGRTRELIYKFRPNPDGFTQGLGLLNGVSAQVEAFMESINHNLSLLKRQVKPSVILKSKENSFFTLTKEERDAVEQYIEEFYSGSMNTGKPFITADFDTEVLNDQSTDVDFSVGTKMTQNAVFEQLGIPLSLIDTSSSTFNNKKTDMLSFYDDTVVPYFTHFTNWLVFNLSIRNSKERNYVKFNPTQIPALAERELENLQKRSKIGHMSVNELREEDELSQIEGGDVIYRPANDVPVANTDNEVDESKNFAVDYDKYLRRT